MRKTEIASGRLARSLLRGLRSRRQSAGWPEPRVNRTYTCAGLQALVAARGFVFIGNPDFQDFVVAGEYYCSGNDRVDLRSAATSDNPQCPVHYCVTRPTVEGPS